MDNSDEKKVVTEIGTFYINDELENQISEYVLIEGYQAKYLCDKNGKLKWIVEDYQDGGYWSEDEVYGSGIFDVDTLIISNDIHYQISGYVEPYFREPKDLINNYDRFEKELNLVETFLVSDELAKEILKFNGLKVFGNKNSLGVVKSSRK